MSSGNTLAGHLRTFFHDHLIAQRNVSPHTVLAYRDAIKLLLVFAAERLRKPVARLGFEDLGVETVLGFLEYLEKDRNNSVATRNARLAALHVFYQHVAARDPIVFAQCQRVLGIPAKRGLSPEVDYLERDAPARFSFAVGGRDRYRNLRDGALRNDGQAIKIEVQHQFTVVSVNGGEAQVADQLRDFSVYVDASTKEPLPGQVRPDEANAPVSTILYFLRNEGGTWKVERGELHVNS